MLLDIILTFHLFEEGSFVVSADIQCIPCERELACELPGNFSISAVHLAIGVLGL